MELPLTRKALPRVYWHDSLPSTNAKLREMIESGTSEGRVLPHGTLVATADQTAGRGRLGRDWVTPPGTALAASLLLRPTALAGGLALSWLPLLVGSAVAAALQPLFRSAEVSDEVDGSDKTGDNNLGEEPKRVGVKWPNDVHVRGEAEAIAGSPGAKLSGILCEMLPSGEVIAGFGMNLLQDQRQMPTERAGSVLVSGGRVGGAVTLADPRGELLADRVLSQAATELLALVELAGQEPERARARVLRDSLTVGSEVRVHLPNGEIVDGRAVGLAKDGELIVDRPTGGQLIVNAADIEHLR